MKRKHYHLLTGILAALLTATPLVILAGYFAYTGEPESIAESDFLAVSQDNLSASASSETPKVTLKSTSQFVRDESNSVSATTESVAMPTVAMPTVATAELIPAQVDAGTPTTANPANHVIPVQVASDNPVEPSVQTSIETHDIIPGIAEAPAPSVAVAAPLEVPTRVAVNDSYYEATGHLALISQQQTVDAAGTQSADSDEPDPALIEEVHVTTPVEKIGVAQVENLVASTRAKGWPIALIRSDIPDDVWWVQQVVGIQGNSFAARLNFGNHNSLSGSTYTMVIVFLDSPDEVRRFRIAKQFKDIPEGLRRSREFNYVRN